MAGFECPDYHDWGYPFPEEGKAAIKRCRMCGKEELYVPPRRPGRRITGRKRGRKSGIPAATVTRKPLVLPRMEAGVRKITFEDD